MNLIFLISQPRSGSTLLQRILSNSPYIATTSEPWVALHPVFSYKKYGLSSIYNSNLATSALEEFLNEIGEDINFYKKQVASFLSTFYQQACSYQSKEYFLDKTPRYYYIIEDLAELFPESKFIILFRNPLGVLNSILNTWIKSNSDNLYKYFDDLTVAPELLVQFAEKHPRKCIRINYENLVRDPEVELLKLFDFIGIKFNNNILQYNNIISNKWKFGDQTKVYHYGKPDKKIADSWIDCIRDSPNLPLALSYLEYLDKSIIEKMGYRREEIKAALKIFDEDKPIKFETFFDISKTSETAQLHSEVKKLKAEISHMRNTLSWRLTSYFRNSNFISKILYQLKS